MPAQPVKLQFTAMCVQNSYVVKALREFHEIYLGVFAEHYGITANLTFNP